MLDNKLLWMLYYFLILFVFLGKFGGCTIYKDFYLDATTDPDYLIPENLKNTPKNDLDSGKTDNLNSEESNEFDIIKFNNEKNYLNIDNEYNQPQEIDKNLQNESNNNNNNNNNNSNDNDKKGKNEEENKIPKDEDDENDQKKILSYVIDGVEHVQDLVTNHKKQIHTNFEKQKSLYRKNPQVKGSNENNNKKKKNFNENNQNYDSKNKSLDKILQKKSPTAAFQIRFNQENLPYYQGQVNYFGDKMNPIDDKAYNPPLYEIFTKNHKSNHHSKHNHHHHHQHQHHNNNNNQYNSNHQYQHPHNHRQHSHYNTNKFNNNQIEYNKNQQNKWPHLSRVQFQLDYDEINNNNNNNNKGQQNEQDNLPPYIKKYNRRNKQLKDLLEGTVIPPLTSLQPLPIQTTTMSTILSKQQDKEQKPISKINGKHLKNHHNHHNHHHRFHNHKNPKWIIEDLFEEQKANPNNPNASTEDDQYMNDSTVNFQQDQENQLSTKNHHHNDLIELLQNNNLPNEDDSFPTDDYEILDFNDNKQNLLNENSNQNIMLTSTKTIENPKRIASIASGFIKKSSSLSSLPSSSSSSSSLSSSKNNNKNENFKVSPNTFIYHRVDAPRMVGIGDIGKKQKLPFVAITDRRLVTSQTQQQQKQQQRQQSAVIEQNHFPLP